MLNSASPFYIKPRLDMDLMRWCWAFWRSANHSTVQRNIKPLQDMLSLSRELTVDIKNELGNSFRMEEKGCFMLYKDAKTERHEQQLAADGRNIGLETKIYNGNEIQAFETEVEVNVRGGVLYTIDCHLHPGDFMRTLKDYLQKKGVKFQLGTTITGFEKQHNKITTVLTDKGDFRCHELVIAAGSWLPLLLKKIGIELLLQAGKGYSITYPNINRNLRYPAILIERRVAMTPMGADLRMGGTMEISGINNSLLIKRVHAIHNAAKNYYPGLDVPFPAAENIWQGLRPLTPDGLPYIGRHSAVKNITVGGGHAMLGLSLAAGTGKIIEEIISNKKPSAGITAFNTERFN